MALVGKASAVGVDRQPGVGLVLPGVGTVVPTVWSILIGAVGRGDDDSGDYLCGVNTPYHREAGETESRWVMGDTCVQGVATGAGDEVGGQVYKLSSRNGSTVGVPTTTLVGIHAVNQI